MICALLALGLKGQTVKDNWTELNRDVVLPPRTHFSSSLPLSDQGNVGQWTLDSTHSDEFNGGSLDASKWTYGMHGWIGHEPSFFTNNNVNVRSGALQIAMLHQSTPSGLDPKVYHDYSTGAIQSASKCLYGYYEVRALPMRSKASSAFFFTDNTPAWWTEIDVFEIAGAAPGMESTDTMSVHVFHTPTDPNHWVVNTGYKYPAGNLDDEYHTYGVDWEPDLIRYYVDGVLVWQGKNTHWNQPLYMSFDAEVQSDWFGLPPFSELPATYYVDYIRAWKKGG